MCTYCVYGRFSGSRDDRDYYYNPCYPLNYPANDNDACNDNTAAVSLTLRM